MTRLINHHCYVGTFEFEIIFINFIISSPCQIIRLTLLDDKEIALRPFSDKDRSVQMSRATSPQSVIVGRPPTNATLVARFCRERAPRTCEHALLRRSRACAQTESFLSKGDSLTLELKLTQGTALK